MEPELIEPKVLPKWVTLPLGVILFPFSLMCITGSLIMLLAPNVPISIFTIIIGSLFLFGSVWVSLLSFRLIFSSYNKGKDLVSPNGLRAVAILFFCIPILAIVLGTFMDKPFVYSVQTIFYFFIAFRLFSFARFRENKSSEK